MQAGKNFSLKDQLFNAETLADLVVGFQRAQPDFPVEAFSAAVLSKFSELELTARIQHIADCLHAVLPSDFSAAAQIVQQALPPELDPSKTDDDFGHFIFASLSQYVADHGCSAEHIDCALDTLQAITRRFSAEYGIRYFLNAFPEQTLAFLQTCAKSENYHVRRLASEGSRPNLPWGKGLSMDWQLAEPILDGLYTDSTRFVTRSVANHLNDLSKKQPDWVVAKLQAWQAAQQKTTNQTEKEMQFIIQHALRTLVKQGHVGAMELLGFTSQPKITVEKLVVHTPQVVVGTACEFELVMTSGQEQKLVIDYHLQPPVSQAKNGSGKPSKGKIFKLKQLNMEAGEQMAVTKKHPMKLMTTRKLILGEYVITLQVNGQAQGQIRFELVE